MHVLMKSPMNSNLESHSDRSAQYNATLVEIVPIHDHLRIFRVVPDDSPIEYLPGQYVALGLGNWEIGDPSEPADEGQTDAIIQRAYSISFPILNRSGDLIRPGSEESLEFYIALIPPSQFHRLALTPRLFRLEPGDRLWIGKRAHGNYTLHSFSPDRHLVFVATGTGEAPHNAMIAEQLFNGFTGPITNVASVRH